MTFLVSLTLMFGAGTLLHPKGSEARGFFALAAAISGAIAVVVGLGRWVIG